MSSLILHQLTRKSNPRVVYYHQVGVQSDYYQGCISAQAFTDQLQQLIKFGFKFISLSEALEHDSKSKKPSICLTTDDGFACNITAIYPILKEMKIPLTIFLLGKCVDNQAFCWNHRIAYIRKVVGDEAITNLLFSLQDEFMLAASNDLGIRLFSVQQNMKEELVNRIWSHFGLPDEIELLKRDKPFLSIEDLHALQADGVDLALHSYSHADFSRLSYQELRAEIQDTIRVLSRGKIKYNPWVAFPYGRQCSISDMQKLQQDLGIERFFGIRYRWGDNNSTNLLWQRHDFEHQNSALPSQLIWRPILRGIKDILK